MNLSHKSLLSFEEVNNPIMKIRYVNIFFFLMPAVVFGVLLGLQIHILNSKLSESIDKHQQEYANMQLMSEIYVNEIQTQKERIDYLERENHIQAVALEEQADMLNNYDHHVDDLQKELNAYEIALEEAAPMFQLPTTWEGPVLTKEIGGNMGPAGRETYYNLPMQGCINKMRSLGYSEEEYPYWVRDDGAKMLGRYVMIAANWKIRPLGTIIETSLGWSIVVDTGTFVEEYPYGVDIAVDW